MVLKFKGVKIAAENMEDIAEASGL